MKYNKYVVKFRKTIKKYDLPIGIYLLYFIVILTLIFSLTYSKYVTAESADATSANAAKIIIKTTDSTGKQDYPVKLENIYPGETTYTEFCVTNNDETNISEVAIKYTISLSVITPYGANIPADYSVQKYDGTNWKDIDSDTWQYMKAGLAETDIYRICVTWPSDDNLNTTEMYSNQLDWLALDVRWQQVGS